MAENETTTASLRGHPLSPALAAMEWPFGGCPTGHRLRCHLAADFERLIQIVGEARGLLACAAEIDAIVAGQAPERQPKSAQLYCRMIE